MKSTEPEAMAAEPVAAETAKAPSDVHFCVAWQGRLYEDACIALILKNMRGRILLYREMFYEVRPGTPMHLATKVDPERRLLIELDDRPAAEV